MTIKSIGVSAKSLKGQAKKLAKEMRIKYTAALDLAAVIAGYSNWKHFLNQSDQPITRKRVARRPEVPEPPVLNYHDTRTGAVLGAHPNAKMTLKRHQGVGMRVQELINWTEYHKRAKKPLGDIRLILDNWLACEYGEKELPNDVFNRVYYGNRVLINESLPTQQQQNRLKRLLREAKSIIDCSYHDCPPLKKLHGRFELALKALEKWPTSIRVPQYKERKKHITAGTFVRLKNRTERVMIFSHDIRRSVVEGYTNAGYFLAGRHEVAVCKEQPDVAGFKPMRLYLPYGKWTCDDRTEVLFNRDYCPIWSKSGDGEVQSIGPDVRVNYQESEFYYDDRSAPYYGNQATLSSCLSILQDWGVEQTLPQVFD